MYTSINFKTKKELKAAVKAGTVVAVYQAVIGRGRAMRPYDTEIAFRDDRIYSGIIYMSR